MENSLAVMRPEIVTEWSSRNMPLKPEDVACGSKKIYWWRGKCGHEWEVCVKARSQGEKCPVCAGKRIVPGINDLQSLVPEFCNCPLYMLGDRGGGNYSYTDKGIKNRTNCTLPHNPKGYDYVLAKFGVLAELAKANRKETE